MSPPTRWVWLAIAASGLAVGVAACAQDTVRFLDEPIDGTSDVAAESGAVFDPKQSADGNGSLRIAVSGDRTIPIATGGNIMISDDARFHLRVFLRSRGGTVAASPELAIRFLDGREISVRPILRGVKGDTEWTMVRASFPLESGDVISEFVASLKVSGAGTVWLDRLSVEGQKNAQAVAPMDPKAGVLLGAALVIAALLLSTLVIARRARHEGNRPAAIRGLTAIWIVVTALYLLPTVAVLFGYLALGLYWWSYLLFLVLFVGLVVKIDRTLDRLDRQRSAL